MIRCKQRRKTLELVQPTVSLHSVDSAFVNGLRPFDSGSALQRRLDASIQRGRPRFGRAASVPRGHPAEIGQAIDADFLSLCTNVNREVDESATER